MKWISKKINHFVGTNNTSGGSVFQGSIRTKSGAVNINLGGNTHEQRLDATARKEQRKQELHSWLKQVDQSNTQYTHQQSRDPMTGQWFLNVELFEEWIYGKVSFIWLNGDVGSGKTILCSSIIEKVRSSTIPDNSLSQGTMAYFYVSWADASTHDIGVILRSILAQVALDDRFTHELEALRKDNDKRVVNRDDMFIRLRNALTKIEAQSNGMNGTSDAPNMAPIFLILDALDEVPYGPLRDVILDFIAELTKLKLRCLRILLTSRREGDISERLRAMTACKPVTIDPHDVKEDIRQFIDHQIARHWNLKMQPEEVKLQISNGIVEMAGGMFQLASLQVQEVQKCRQRTLRTPDVEFILRTLPRGVQECYERILKQIPPNLFEECLTALKWLAFSQRPLYIEELVDACVLTPSAFPSFDPSRRLSPMDLLNNLVGLATVEPYLANNSSTILPAKYTVALAHLSVQEYLVPSRPSLSNNRDRICAFEAHLAHREIARACLAYLSACSLADSSILIGYTLKDYAWHWWATHAAASEPLNDPVHATKYALRLFNTIVYEGIYGHSERASRDTLDAQGHFQDLISWLQPTHHGALLSVLKNASFPYVATNRNPNWEFSPLGVRRYLPKSARVLRLVILHPARNIDIHETPLECSICVDTLDNEPVYSALSYVGSDNVPYTYDSEDRVREPDFIQLHGRPFAIGQNLVSALRRLRSDERSRILWVDALCIVMEDLAERAEQVSLMSYIYRSAIEVIAWVGMEDAYSDKAIRLLDASANEIDEADAIPESDSSNFPIRFQGQHSRSWSPMALQPPEARGWTPSEFRNPRGSEGSNIYCLDVFFQRRFWKRSWILQEIICANKVILYCGTASASVDWDKLKNLRSLHVQKEYSCLGDDEYDPRLQAVVLQQLRRGQLCGISHGLLEFLQLTHAHRCTDPRDKIYSLISLLPESDRDNELSRVNYTITRAEVYALATQFIIAKSNNLEVLSCTPAHFDTSLPTWVPDWNHLRPSILNTDLYTADAGLSDGLKYQFSKAWEEILIDGFLVDTIETADERWDDGLISLHQVEVWQRVFRMNNLGIRQFPEVQSSMEACWRTLLGDRLVDRKGYPHRIDKDNRFQPDDKSQREQVFLLSLQKLAHLRDQCFVITSKGFVGFTHHSAKKGDMVVILPGARMPLVVRADTKYEAGALRVPCRLVGTSYVHGLMDGEFARSWLDPAKSPRRFEIH